MFCPKCATQNVEGSKFCRSCGTDISLVPQLMTGALAERLAAVEESRRGGGVRDDKDAVTIERAIRHLFMGIAFFFIAFAVKTWAPAGNIWWFWMFLPAAGLLADGVGTYLRLASEGKPHAPPPPYTPAQTTVPPPPRHAGSLSPADTGEMVPPPSVTEGTTRHLSVPAEHKRSDV